MVDEESAPNRPRNHLVTDATKPFEFTFNQYGKAVTIIVDQTAEDETWPGGALWDIGVLLSHVLVGIAGFTSPRCNKLPSRLLSAFPSTKDLSVLELGCGVGLTGIVASAALGTQLTILTDLKVVVENVTEPNMVKNTTAPPDSKQPFRVTKIGKRGRVVAMPLCWASEVDEIAVQETLVALTRPQRSPPKTKRGGKHSVPLKDSSKPDIIVVGDVAYQHKSGAPSHFDALLSTVLRFLGPHTLVLFGTRMRMPASRDLLELFSVHMEEIMNPPSDKIFVGRRIGSDSVFAPFRFW